jgi:hypothetical protein
MLVADNEKPNSDKTIPEKQLQEGIDLGAFRLSQDFGVAISVQKIITTVPVHKPNKQNWIMIHPDEGWRMDAATLEIKGENEFYLVTPEMYVSFPDECMPVTLVTCITRQGAVFLWPVRLPREEGRFDQWGQSALEIVAQHSGKWIRVVSNRHLGAYEVYHTRQELPDPEWPEEGFSYLVNKAFKGKVIDRPDHPIIRQLREGA